MQAAGQGPGLQPGPQQDRRPEGVGHTKRFLRSKTEGWTRSSLVASIWSFLPTSRTLLLVTRQEASLHGRQIDCHLHEGFSRPRIHRHVGTHMLGGTPTLQG